MVGAMLRRRGRGTGHREEQVGSWPGLLRCRWRGRVLVIGRNMWDSSRGCCGGGFQTVCQTVWKKGAQSQERRSQERRRVPCQHEFGEKLVVTPRRADLQIVVHTQFKRMISVPHFSILVMIG